MHDQGRWSPPRSACVAGSLLAGNLLACMLKLWVKVCAPFLPSFCVYSFWTRSGWRLVIHFCVDRRCFWTCRRKNFIGSLCHVSRWRERVNGHFSCDAFRSTGWSTRLSCSGSRWGFVKDRGGSILVRFAVWARSCVPKGLTGGTGWLAACDSHVAS